MVTHFPSESQSWQPHLLFGRRTQWLDTVGACCFSSTKLRITWDNYPQFRIWTPYPSISISPKNPRSKNQKKSKIGYPDYPWFHHEKICWIIMLPGGNWRSTMVDPVFPPPRLGPSRLLCCQHQGRCYRSWPRECWGSPWPMEWGQVDHKVHGFWEWDEMWWSMAKLSCFLVFSCQPPKFGGSFWRKQSVRETHRAYAFGDTSRIHLMACPAVATAGWGLKLKLQGENTTSLGIHNLSKYHQVSSSRVNVPWW